MSDRMDAILAALKPFDDIGTEMFCNNWNASDVVKKVNGVEIRFEHFLNLHQALQGGYDA